MSEDILNPEYWKQRLDHAKERDLHHSIFLCGKDQWGKIENHHRSILQQVIGPNDSVLDAGCGYGRLLTLMPQDWIGDYVGIDLSPDFVAMARHEYPSRSFYVGDLTTFWDTGEGGHLNRRFDWAVLISIRPMVINYVGEETWRRIEKGLRRVANKLLYLEYTVDDKGEME